MKVCRPSGCRNSSEGQTNGSARKLTIAVGEVEINRITAKKKAHGIRNVMPQIVRTVQKNTLW